MPRREYVWLNDLPLALIAASNSDSGVYAVHTDHLGTPQKLTDQNQQIVWDAGYEPFGSTTLYTNQIKQPLRLPSQYADIETGLFQNWRHPPVIEQHVSLESNPGTKEIGRNWLIIWNGCIWV